MAKQPRSAGSDSLTPSTSSSSTSATEVADPAMAYADPVMLQNAPGGGNAAVAAMLGSQGADQESELCAGIGMVSSVGQTRLIDQTLGYIYEAQVAGLKLFKGAAKGEDASYSEQLAVTVAEKIISTAISDVATMAVSAAAASTGVGAVVQGALLAGAQAAQGKITGDLAKKVLAVMNDPSADWLEGFVEAQSEALYEAKRATGKAWIRSTDGIDAEELCGLNEALESVLAAAEGVQYRHCVAGWAEYCGRQAGKANDDVANDSQRESFGREYELRIDVALDPADPRKVEVEGGAIPGLAPDLLANPHMAGVTVANAGFATRVVSNGAEIFVGAGGRVLEVRTATAEAREQLRRLGTEGEKSAAPGLWGATTAPLGDEQAELHVQNGAQKLVSLHIAPKTLAALGVPGGS